MIVLDRNTAWPPLCPRVTRASKGVITRLKCQEVRTRVTTSATSPMERRVIGMIMLGRQCLNWYTHSRLERIHPGILKQLWFAQTQTGLHNYTPLFSSTACASAQTSHWSCIGGQDVGEREEEERRGEGPRSCGMRCSKADVLSGCRSVTRWKTEEEQPRTAYWTCEWEIHSCALKRKKTASGSEGSVAPNVTDDWFSSGLAGSPYDYEICPNDLIR